MSPRDPCTTILLCSTYTLYSPPLTFCGLCAISVGIFTKALTRLLVKSLIVGHIDGAWSRTLCLLPQNSSTASIYQPRCPPPAPMVFVNIILDFAVPCLSTSCLFNEQRSSSARQYFLLFRILISQTKVNRSARQHRSTISSGSFTRSGKLSLSCQSCLSARNDSYQFILDDQFCFVLHIVCCMNTAFIIHVARSRQVYIEWLEATVLSSTTCV